MKHNIEIKIECKGKAAGTLGWFNSIMENSEFIIKENKAGIPAIFLKAKRSQGDGYDFYFLAKKSSTMDNPSDYIETDDGYLMENAQTNYVVSGFSDYPLTPACKSAVEEMIFKAKEIFADWWENDKG